MDFETIMDYDDFDVVRDVESGKYIYRHKDGDKYIDETEVKLIASLVYDKDAEMFIDDICLSEMFSNTCCGEEFNGTSYLWFE